MASFAFVDAQIFVAGYDFTGDSNQVALKAEVEELDATTFRSGGTRERKGGLRNTSADVSGFWQSDDVDAVDPQVFPALGVPNRVVTLSPTGTEGDVAYLFRGGKFSYDMFGQVGELTPFSLSMLGSDGVGLVRGRLAKAKGSVSTAGALGSALNLGPVASDQHVYASLHVVGTPGTTITVLVESDDSAGFASPTTRGTIGPITAAGGTWMARVAGPITDTHWRFNVSAVTGTFTVAGAIAVQ